VRYDPARPEDATVVSLTPPQTLPNGVLGWVAVSGSLALTVWSCTSMARRRWQRLQEREDGTDYRDDEWAGGSHSA